MLVVRIKNLTFKTAPMLRYVGPNGKWYQFKSFEDAKEYIEVSWKKHKRESRYTFLVKDHDYGKMLLEIVRMEDDKNPRVMKVERKRAFLETWYKEVKDVLLLENG